MRTLNRRFDRTATRHPCDADSIAAREGRIPAFEHALDRFPAVEKHGVVAAPGGGDETPFEATQGRIVGPSAHHGTRASTLAAQMQSFCVMPPALCVDHETAQRS